MESMAKIVDFISFTWITGIAKQQYIITVLTVIKFQAGPKLDLESHEAVFWDFCFSSIYN